MCVSLFFPDMFNITNMRGKVAKFCIFKTVYRLGEDIIGTFNFSEGDIPCLQVCLLYNFHTMHFPIQSPFEFSLKLCVCLCFSIQWAFRVRRRSSSSTSVDQDKLPVWLDTGDIWSLASTRPSATSLFPYPWMSRRVSAETLVSHSSWIMSDSRLNHISTITCRSVSYKLSRHSSSIAYIS